MKNLSTPTQQFESLDFKISVTSTVVEEETQPLCLVRIRDSNLSSLQFKYLNLKTNFELQRQINCPGLIKSYSIIQDSDEPKILQEPYYTTLQNFPTDTLSYPQKLNIISDLCEAVNCLQKGRLVNLGLRPSKIALVGGKNNYRGKIIFLDEIQPLEEKQEFKKIHPYGLSPFYAPQMHIHENCYTSSDIWSLGCLFYYLLFGTIKGINVWEKEVSVEFPKNTPEWMKQILNRLLAYEPSKRYKIWEFMDRVKSMKHCAQVASRFMPTSFD